MTYLEKSSTLTEIDGHPEIVRHVVLSNIDDPFARASCHPGGVSFRFEGPRAEGFRIASVVDSVPILHVVVMLCRGSAAVETDDFRVGINGVHFGLVLVCEIEQFPPHSQQVPDVAEYELNDRPLVADEMVRLRDGRRTSKKVTKRNERGKRFPTNLRSSLRSLATLSKEPSYCFTSHSSTSASLPVRATM